MVSPARAPTLAQLQDSGLHVARECYADRRYDNTGSIVDRRHPQALLKGAQEAATQIVNVVQNGFVVADDGTQVPMQADTFCLHSDTPGAAQMGKAVVAALKAENITIKPTTGIL